MAFALSRLVDGVIEPFAPQTALRRRQARAALAVQRQFDEQQSGRRRYQAARRERLSSDWVGNGASGNANLAYDLSWLRKRSRQMERDNPEIASAVRNLVVDLSGVDVRAEHDNPRVSRKAQKAWKAYRKLLGLTVLEKVILRELIIGGEAIVLLRPRDKLPNQRIQVLPGEQLDASKTEILGNGNRVVMGVEFDAEGDRVAYWIYPEHPGDILPGQQWTSKRVDARHVLHIFEQLWPDQARGVPWFYASMLTDDEIDQLRQALRVKRRIEACLTVHVTPGEAGREGDQLGQDGNDGSGRRIEKIAPGMMVYGQAGDKVDVINPSSSGGADTFLRSEMMRSSAGKGVPFHMTSGDVSGANYTAIRADIVPYRARLDDWIWTVTGPSLFEPLFAICMELEAMAGGDRRLREATGEIAIPPREWVDPLKDIAALEALMRLLPGQLPEVMAQRGQDWREGMAKQAEVNAEADRLEVVYQGDARVLNGSGGLQGSSKDAASTVGADQNDPDGGDMGAQSLAGFATQAVRAHAMGDTVAMAALVAEVTRSMARRDPMAATRMAVLTALTDN
ncbi:phage portal protein [Caulobacter sp. CCNWLY153]|uniref:phage portal protein n=1 Tax=unclassified Caulobacter TaxID=2648921 RepID=UPI002FF1C764